MGTMLDAVDPANIPANLDGKPALRISVLANPTAEAYDIEPGNAVASDVAAAIVGPIKAGQWKILYVDGSLIGEVTAALKARGIAWTAAVHWPMAGAYLWATDPGIAPGETPEWCPTPPIAVQDRFNGGTDTSWTADNFPAEVAGYIDGPRSEWPAAAWGRFSSITAPAAPTPAPEPKPATGGDVQVTLPTLSNGSTGESVKAVQILLGGLTVDGIYGPLTDSRVQAYQRSQDLAIDGVVGLHTWGQLLGAHQ
jgi:peptidoglycan hydrolase-like protein with peptidoglycan-binding domain